ncbi:hypothetical protein Leryth_006524 [Lithospermum erythrorhizon]|nr:hypothetical protein Leryth_006524 [Lithospermum erythrorhizon]
MKNDYNSQIVELFYFDYFWLVISRPHKNSMEYSSLWKQVVSSPILSYIHSNIKFIEVILGVVAYIMVQYILQEKSLSLMLALLSFTIAWVGIVAIVQPPTDFGVFTFLIGASVDCAISVFRLGRATWIVSGVCILLLIIYRKLDSVLLIYSGVQGGVVRDWTSFELYKHLQLLFGITDTYISGGDNADEQTWHIQMSPTTFLKIKKGDITKWFVDGSTDAIVNSTNERMIGDGGCDGAIHASAGDELYAECNQVPEVSPGVRCRTGEARITRGHRLPVSHVIHTVGPVYYESDRKELLKSAYEKSLQLAKANNIKYIAFPAISCGIHGYPIDEAAEVALSTVKEHANELKEVHFVLFLDEIYNVWLEKALGCKILEIR